jgi:hypothetical protein
MKFQRTTAISALVFTTTLAGCATNSELSKVRTEAIEARRVADQALVVANEANQRSERTEEMVHRSFRHSMKK